jgi:drug/metabolite transporter (DMT)-like permease
MLSGALGNFFPAFLFAIAIEKKIDSALAGILNSLTPLFVIVIAVLFFKAKVQQKKIIGVLIGFVGLTILSLSKGGISFDNYVYALLILVATIMYGLNVNIVTQYLKDIEPMKLATVSLGIMSLFAAVVMWQQDVFSMAVYDEGARLSIFYAALLGIVGSAFATALFYALIKRAGGLFASLVTYGIPVVAIFWGIVAGEVVTAIQISCLALILGGVYLANRA